MWDDEAADGSVLFMTNYVSLAASGIARLGNRLGYCRVGAARRVALPIASLGSFAALLKAGDAVLCR